MTFRRLMFRAWLVLSGLWASAVAFYPLALALIDKRPLEASTDPEPWIALLVMALCPPTVLYVLGRAIAWPFRNASPRKTDGKARKDGARLQPA
jgi:hypothetical protein